jgi:hypothetical protein
METLMRIIMLLIALSLLGACTKKDEVLNQLTDKKVITKTTPDKVKEAFKTKYPNAQNAEWESEEGVYEVEFVLGEKKYEAEFDGDANWLITETEIKFEDLPNPIKNILEKNYSEYEIEEVEQVETAEFDEMLYEIEMEKDDKEIELFFNASGEIKKQEVENDNEEEDDDEEEDDKD